MDTRLDRLIDELIEDGILKTRGIIDAFRKIDRKDFVLLKYINDAYLNRALSIGHEVTISQPLTVAFMLELLSPKDGEKILDVGSGSGWTTALLAHLVGGNGKIYGVEIIPELIKFGQDNLAKYNFKHAEIIQATKNLGLQRKAPFDKILVSAGDIHVPEELVKQLKIGGIMVIPIQRAIWKVKRVSDTETNIEKFEGFIFVPLINRQNPRS